MLNEKGKTFIEIRRGKFTFKLSTRARSGTQVYEPDTLRTSNDNIDPKRFPERYGKTKLSFETNTVEQNPHLSIADVFRILCTESKMSADHSGNGIECDIYNIMQQKPDLKRLTSEELETSKCQRKGEDTLNMFEREECLNDCKTIISNQQDLIPCNYEENDGSSGDETETEFEQDVVSENDERNAEIGTLSHSFNNGNGENKSCVKASELNGYVIHLQSAISEYPFINVNKSYKSVEETVSAKEVKVGTRSFNAICSPCESMEMDAQSQIEFDDKGDVFKDEQDIEPTLSGACEPKDGNFIETGCKDVVYHNTDVVLTEKAYKFATENIKSESLGVNILELKGHSVDINCKISKLHKKKIESPCLNNVSITRNTITLESMDGDDTKKKYTFHSDTHGIDRHAHESESPGQVNQFRIESEEIDGDETETEFEPLEGDEWESNNDNQNTESMDGIVNEGATGNATATSVVINSEAKEKETNCSSADNLTDEDIINKYCAFMPAEISNAVKIKKTLANLNKFVNKNHCEKGFESGYDSFRKKLKPYSPEKDLSHCPRYERQTLSSAREVNVRCHTKSHTCEICFKSFKSQESFYEHLNIHTGDMVSCPFCKKEFSFKKSMYRHIRKNHSGKRTEDKTVGESKHKKKSGDQDLSQKKDFTESRTVKCRFCGLKFEKCKLERHMRAHTGARPYSCDKCPFTASQLGNLNKHKKVVHDKVKGMYQLKYECDICRKRFYDKAHIQRHMLKHSEKSVKHYGCPICHKQFRYDSGLNRHMQLHKDGLKIECGICNKKFYDSTGLTNHLRMHTGDRPFRCTQCDASFTQKSNLRTHERGHVPASLFRCQKCGHRFPTLLSLHKHFLRHKR